MFFEMKFAKFKTVGELRAAAHETLDYIASRVNREGEKMERLLFGWDIYEKAEAEEFIDTLSPKPVRFWRMILSPDPNSGNENLKRDLDVWGLTRSVMAYIRDHVDPHIVFIVAEHNDHTDIPHVQGLVFFQGRLNKYHLNRMRQIAIAQALLQRRVRDRKQTLTFLKNGKQVTRQSELLSAFMKRDSGRAGGLARRGRGMKPIRESIGCENCSYKNAMVKLKNGKYWCPACGKLGEREYELEL
jgi:hypothetical protein